MLGLLNRTPGRTAAAGREKRRARRASIRVGIPRVLSLWSTHQFWVGFLASLGIRPEHIIFSSQTSEQQFREYGKGRGTVDCCFPVKCASGHYGELLARKKKIDVLLAPMVYSLPSFLHGHVQDTLSCPRVMAGPEAIKAGFLRERNTFREAGIAYLTPFVSLANPELAAAELFDALNDAFELDALETRRAVDDGLRALEDFNRAARKKSRSILAGCAAQDRPSIVVLARPYHMDTGIGHEIDNDLQRLGYPILWGQHLPTDEPLMRWLFGAEIDAGAIRGAFDLSDVWSSSYSANTNELLWAAKFATRMPWVACAIHLSSYECGMDQPILTPVQQIVERSGTLYFRFGDLDATKPGGSVRIRLETIAYYIERIFPDLLGRKLGRLPRHGPLLEEPPPEAKAAYDGTGAGSR